MTVIRWQLIAPITDRRVFKAEVLGPPYRSGTAKVEPGDTHAVCGPITTTPPAQSATHVLLVVDVYAGPAFLVVCDDNSATIPAASRSVSRAGEDDLPCSLIVGDGEQPDVPTREIRALRIGPRFCFQAAER